MTAAGAAGSAAANKIFSAFIGIAPSIDEEEFVRGGESASDYFGEGFVEGVTRQAAAGTLRDPFFDAFSGIAQEGMRIGSEFSASITERRFSNGQRTCLRLSKN